MSNFNPGDNDSSQPTKSLNPSHLARLRASNISDAVITQRGYYSANSPDELLALDFKPYQATCPALVIPQFNPLGTLYGYQIRPDTPRTTSPGKSVKYEFPQGYKPGLDCPPATTNALKDRTVPLFFTEGSLKADAAVAAGLICVAVPGVWGFRSTNTSGGKLVIPDLQEIALNERDVYIAFDSDAPQKTQVSNALGALRQALDARGAKVKVIYIPPAPSGAKQGLDDFFAAGGTVEQLLAYATEELQRLPANASEIERISKLTSEMEVFRTPQGEAYSGFQAGEERIYAPLRLRAGRSPEAYLLDAYSRRYGRPAKTEYVREVLTGLEAQTQMSGAVRTVHHRIGRENGRLYLDLANAQGQVVEITRDGWQVLDGTKSDIAFRRNTNLAALPTPERGGSIDELRSVLNFGAEANFQLIIAWLIGAFWDLPAYPILVVLGEPGSAKSMTSKQLRQLVDPVAQAPTRALPFKVEDVIIAANNSHVLAFSNVSTINQAMSDALCRVASGEGYGTRQFYSNSEEVVFGGARPITLNGITDFVTQPDLIDRSIIIRLPAIPESKRRVESEIMQEFETLRPRVLGALLDILVSVEQRLPTVQPQRLYRLADFTKLMIAAEPQLGWKSGSFEAVYGGNRDEAIESGLDAEFVIGILQQWARQLKEPFLGTATDLLSTLKSFAGDSEAKQQWPEGPRALSNKLRRYVSQLRSVGITVAFDQRIGNSKRGILIGMSDPNADGDGPGSGAKSDANQTQQTLTDAKLASQRLPNNPITAGETYATDAKDANLATSLDSASREKGKVTSISSPSEVPPGEGPKLASFASLASGGSAQPVDLTSALNQYQEIWLVDFEFSQPGGERPVPNCMVAHELKSGQVLRLSQTQLNQLKSAPYSTGPDSLIVAYNAVAELSCHLALGWALPGNILDLWVEFRLLTNGIRKPDETGLLSALTYFGLPSIEPTEKAAMRELSMRGGPYTEAEMADLLQYCETDVVALRDLLPRMIPDMDVTKAVERGRYMSAVAQMEHSGIPIDVDAYSAIAGNRGPILRQMEDALPPELQVFSKGKLKIDRLRAVIEQFAPNWPTTEKGEFSRKRAVLVDMGLSYPRLQPLCEVLITRTQLPGMALALGADGRNRCSLRPFGSITGRNQPSSTRFVFGLPKWLRNLIRPEAGKALAYLDYGQQEFAIAAVLSGDKAMIEAYQTGDPYLAAAKQAGLIPPDGTKVSHSKQRDMFKTCSLGLLYGMGANALAARIGCSVANAKDLIARHRAAFRVFWAWSDGIAQSASNGNPLSVSDGWALQALRNDNTRSARNFPIQATGAVILRRTTARLIEAGITICAPLHDALLIEGDLADIDGIVTRAQEIMQQVASEVLDGLKLRVDAHDVRHPNTFGDPDNPTWRRALGAAAVDVDLGVAA